MSRISLAFSCFFGVLFRGRLPGAAVPLLPEEFIPRPPAPPVQRASVTARTLPEIPALREATAAAVSATGSATGAAAAGGSASPGGLARGTAIRGNEAAELRSEGALGLLGLLQREGRLVDFLRETLDQHADAAIGAAVRDIHRGCKKVLDEHLRLEPVMPGREEGPVVVPRGFDPTEVRLIGKTGGDPPFRGTLVHHGWRAVDVKLPTLSEGVDRRVLAPAEVRLG
jgi:hypothetical protein